MNPFRMLIYLVIVSGIFAGIGGKYMVVTGYGSGISIVPKKSFHISPLFINIETYLTSAAYLKEDDVRMFRSNFPVLASELEKYLKNLDKFLVCRENIRIITESTDYFMSVSSGNTVNKGEVDWDQIFHYLPNYEKRICPDNGHYLYYRDNVGKTKVRCSVHGDLEKPVVKH